MDPIRHILPDQRSAVNDLVKQPPGRLTIDDIARLSAKREEIIMTLRLWHGYGRSAADRTLSSWLYQNSPPPSPRV